MIAIERLELFARLVVGSVLPGILTWLTVLAGLAGRPRTGRLAVLCRLAVLAGLGRLTVLPGLAELRRCPELGGLRTEIGLPVGGGGLRNTAADTLVHRLLVLGYSAGV
ncbi:hypothetical protein I545_6874 [Mycobacterium kansasii 662]|uniref:Uncharacterized protein n=1 Tax=Mycobacterium kansasii 662 TaxID=1299326 RepID=X7XPJ8_MYCKA|nr:hypothetical protein I545_6874 [Mycobacterium kansasii 662]